MGLRAYYQSLDDEKLELVKKFDPENGAENFEKLEAWEDEAEVLMDLDKMWDIIHFAFTGNMSATPKEGDPLSQAIFGEHIVESGDFLAYTTKERVPVVLQALIDLDTKKMVDDFSVQGCIDAEIYPSFWGDVTKEDMEQGLIDYYEEIKDFYRKIAKENKNVLIAIY